METLLRKYFKDDQLSDERNPRDAVGGQWADCGRGAGAVEPLPDTGIDDNTTVGCSEYTKSDGIENGTTDRQESGGTTADWPVIECPKIRMEIVESGILTGIMRGRSKSKSYLKR